MQDMLYLINNELYEHIFDIVVPYTVHVNVTYGSPTYYAVEEAATAALLHSGIYINTLANDLHVVYNTSMNITFDEFVDHVYVDFNMEETFYLILRLTYEQMYATLIDYAKDFYEQTDMIKLTTDYMR